MDRIKKISKQTLWLVLNKVIISSCMIVSLGLIARNYGASGIGIFTLTLTLLNFLYLGVDLGINAHILPESLQANFYQIWQKLLGLRIMLSGILILITAFIIFLLPIDVEFKLAVYMGLFSILAVAIFYNCNLLFQSKLRFDLFTLSSSTGSAATLLIIFLLIKYKVDVPYLISGTVPGWFICAVISLILAKKFIKISPKFDINYSLGTLQKIWPLSLTFISNVIYFRIDAFILSYVRNFSEVGIYNLAYQIFQSLLIMPVYIMNSFYPLMIKDFAENRIKFNRNLLKACLVMFTIAFFGMVLTIILAPFAINIIAGGKEFAGSVSALRILSFSFPAFFVTSVLMWVLIMLKKYKAILSIYFFGLIFNAAANMIIIPVYSYIGAAAITGISEYLILLLQVVILIPILKNEKN